MSGQAVAEQIALKGLEQQGRQVLTLYETKIGTVFHYDLYRFWSRRNDFTAADIAAQEITRAPAEAKTFESGMN
jgi:hypothetical protein